MDQDRPRRPGRFLLTGSANLLLMRRVSETLAGRAAYIPLGPLTRGERLGEARSGSWDRLLESEAADWPDILSEGAGPGTRGGGFLRNWRELAREGGYPTPAHELTHPDARRTWFRAYVQTYLERDLQDLASIENLVLADLLAWRDTQRPDAQVLFWRTHAGEEVDFVVEDGDRLLAVEVKGTRRVGPTHARHLRTFREQYGERVHGCLVLYDGDEVFRLSEGIVAAPWHRVI